MNKKINKTLSLDEDTANKIKALSYVLGGISASAIVIMAVREFDITKYIGKTNTSLGENKDA